MPSTFDDFGIRFLYPDNWTLQSRDSDARSEGITLELPYGGFFSVTRYQTGVTVEQLFGDIIAAMRGEYPELEIERIAADDRSPHRMDETLELHFYYLDLLVVARAVAIEDGDAGLVLVQIQAESRDFEKNELVYSAVIKSLKDHLELP